MIRWAVVGASILVIAAATHWNVSVAGGYASPSGVLAVALAVFLIVAGGFIGNLFSDRRWIAGTLVVVFLICGEAYWLFTNADRELIERENMAAPTLTLAAARQAAKKRLEDATAAKTAADEAMISEAAKPGCRKNCADLLTRNQDAAATEQNAARAALTGLPGARSAAALAEHLGIARWAWDLIMAALRSIAVMGASLVIGIAAHPVRTERKQEAPTAPPRNKRQRVERIETAIARPQNRRNHVAKFLADTLEPDTSAKASLREIHGRYLPWCQSLGLAPLPAEDLGSELREIVNAIGLEIETAETGRDVLLCGAMIR